MTKAEIYKIVPGYADGDEDTIEKRFTRDKDELRELGINILIEDSYYGQKYVLGKPSKNLTSELSDTQRMLAHAAANLWSVNADPNFGVKLLATFEPAPAMPAAELGGAKAFGTVARAISQGKPVTFNYVSSKNQALLRTVEPWYLFLQEGNLYVRGYDRGREDARTFRMSRVVLDDKLAILDEELTQPVPEDIQGGLDYLAPVFAVEQGSAELIRQHSCVLENHDYETIEGWDYMQGDPESFREWTDRILSQAEHVVVLEPDVFCRFIDKRIDALARMGGENG